MRFAIGLALCLASAAHAQVEAPPPAPSCDARGKTTVEAAQIAQKLRDRQPVVLQNALVTGAPLDLANATVAGELRITDSLFEVPVTLDFATFQSRVDLSRSCFRKDVRAHDAAFQKYAAWEGADFHGLFSANSATVTPGASFAKAVFRGNGSFARARFAGSVDFVRARFLQEAQFFGVSIGGQAAFQGAVFARIANFERASIAETAFFREQPEGAGMLPAAQFHGVANFKAASVGGQANFNGVQFHDEVRMTQLRAEELWFWGVRFHSGHDKDSNDIYLNDAQVGMLDFGGNRQLMKLLPGRELNLSGLTYKRLNTPWQDMLELFGRSGRYYNRQPYKFLENQYRDSGEITRANRVYYARRLAEGDRLAFFGDRAAQRQAQPVRWTWDRTLRYSIGYGVRWEYPALWLLAIILSCTALLSRRDAIVPNYAPETGAPADQPIELPIRRVMIALLMSINLVIPKLDLPGVSRWRITDNRFGKLPVTYTQIGKATKYLAWTVTTVALSVFGFTDLVKD